MAAMKQSPIEQPVLPITTGMATSAALGSTSLSARAVMGRPRPDAGSRDAARTTGRRAQLAALERQVRQIERGGALDKAQVLSLGLPALDEALPGGGLPIAGLHEILPARAEWDDGATTGFLAALLVRLLAQEATQSNSTDGLPEGERSLLWVGPYEDLYGPGLAAAGLPPERLLRVKARKDEEVLWALEEALTCQDLLAVVGEVSSLDRIAARRLQLAAETAGKACFLLRRPRLAHHQPEGASAAVSRWQVTTRVTKTARPDEGAEILGLGKACWQVDLLRCRSARPTAFHLEWDHETGHLNLATELLPGTTGRSAVAGVQPTTTDAQVSAAQAAEPLYA